MWFHLSVLAFAAFASGVGFKTSLPRPAARPIPKSCFRKHLGRCVFAHRWEFICTGTYLRNYLYKRGARRPVPLACLCCHSPPCLDVLSPFCPAKPPSSGSPVDPPFPSLTPHRPALNPRTPMALAWAPTNPCRSLGSCLSLLPGLKPIALQAPLSPLPTRPILRWTGQAAGTCVCAPCPPSRSAPFLLWRTAPSPLRGPTPTGSSLTRHPPPTAGRGPWFQHLQPTSETHTKNPTSHPNPNPAF